jgi:hypothetical protein
MDTGPVLAAGRGWFLRPRQEPGDEQPQSTRAPVRTGASVSTGTDSRS